MGSTRAARRAGNQLAATATTLKTTAPAANVAASVAVTPYRNWAMTRVSPTLNASPITTPMTARRTRSEEHTSELQLHRDLHSFPTRRSSDLRSVGRSHSVQKLGNDAREPHAQRESDHDANDGETH